MDGSALCHFKAFELISKSSGGVRYECISVERTQSGESEIAVIDNRGGVDLLMAVALLLSMHAGRPRLRAGSGDTLECASLNPASTFEDFSLEKLDPFTRNEMRFTAP